MHRLDRPGGRIAYDLHGPAGGPLVVCVPGMADVRATYRHLAPALAGAGYRVAVMDLRGHGDSDASFTDYGTLATAADTAALIEELGGPAIAVGNSLGATAAAWVAATRPELVSGTVLLGAFLRGDGLRGPLALLLRAMLLRPWGPALGTAYLRGLFKGRTTEGHAEHIAAIRAGLGPADRYRAVTATIANSFRPVPARLDEVAAPALVVMGADDPDWPDPAAEADWIAGRLGARRLIVPECGHYPAAQRPDLVAPAVLEFAAAVAPAGGADA
ncbi:alpha/beta hydrolase [Nocardiopsis sp. CNT-189]|uniref:alpha/beta fold hydrolase n=1 Tax=Nocardiopsis oceanisediminis TaxID=2816862 RepID=UPI003B3846BA